VARTRKIRLRVGVRTKGLGPAQRKLRRAEETLDANMSIGVYRGMLAIARRQKFLAPAGRHGSIPRSIRVLPARRVGKAFVSSSQTSLPLAFFHEEGTGLYGPYGTPYTLYWRMSDGTRRPGGRPQHGGADYSSEGGRPVKHPGVQASRFFEKGFTYGAEEAADTLYRQVGRSFVR
jgi:hypothetical protein